MTTETRTARINRIDPPPSPIVTLTIERGGVRFIEESIEKEQLRGTYLCAYVPLRH